MKPGFVLGTVLAEKYLDILAYGILIVTAPLLMPIPPGILDEQANFPIFLLLALFMLVVFLASRSILERGLKWLNNGAIGSIGVFISSHLLAALESFSVFKKFRESIGLVIVTILIWLSALATNWIVWEALDLDLPIEAAFILLVVLIAGISLPSLPGKVGTFEYASIFALSFFGLDQTTSLSYGILLHVVVYAPIIILGILSIWYLQMRTFSSASS